MSGSDPKELLNLADRVVQMGDDATGLTKLKMVEQLAKARQELDLQAEESGNLKAPLSLSERIAIDAVLMGAGFDPGVEYIRQHYGEHWHKTMPPDPAQAPQTVDFKPLLEGFGAISGMLQQNQEQINGLVTAIAGIASQIAGSSATQDVLLSALAEARKPISLDIQMTMPEQRPKRFVAERTKDGRMTLTEETPPISLQ